MSVFSNGEQFEHAQRIAKMLCSSDLVPASYKGNMANTLVALEMAHRLKDSPLMVMQNMNVIHGKPSWGSSYIIAKINGSGRFSPLKFRLSGEGDQRTCVAYATEIASREVVEGPPISITMAKKEGWYGKSGSKWPTMPELMLQYRAAAFFGRLHTPDLLMGMQTTEEIYDVSGVSTAASGSVAVDELNAEASQPVIIQQPKKTSRSNRKPEPDPAPAQPGPDPDPDDDDLI